MKRIGTLLSLSCILALVAMLVPAVASGVSIASPNAAALDVDDRGKPKPKPGAPVPPQARAVEKWINAQPKTYMQATSTFQITVDPVLVGTEWEAAATRGVKAAFEIHQMLGQPVTRPYRVYIGWDAPWLRATVPQDACPVIFDYALAAACAGSDVIYMRLALQQQWMPWITPTSPVSSYARFSIVGLLGHELTHHVQQSLYPLGTTRTYPEASTWLVEGWASMVQMMIAMRSYGISYSRARDQQLKVLDTKCTGIKLKDLLAPTSFTNCEYVSGLLATEYLMWKTGDMRAGWTYVSQDALTSREAFSEAYGLDLDTFMEEAEKYVYRELALWPKREGPK